MKAARFILKSVALGLVIGSALCAVIAYWDKIIDVFYNLADKLEERRANRSYDDFDDAEYSDYEDWESC